MKEPQLSLDWDEAIALAHAILQIEDIGMYARTVNVSCVRGNNGPNVEFCALKCQGLD